MWPADLELPPHLHLLAIYGRTKSDGPRSFASHDQSAPVKPRLCQNMLFNELWRDRLHPPANRPLGPPDFGQTRRIPIFKRAIADQGWRWAKGKSGLGRSQRPLRI